MDLTEKLFSFIADKLDTDPDYPFSDGGKNAVFRHRGNGKWFAVFLRGVPRAKLGCGEGKTDVVNFKCDPLFSGSARELPGVYPAYHMNKEHWVSVALDEADEETLCALACMSYDLTFPKVRGRVETKGEKGVRAAPINARALPGGRRGYADSADVRRSRN